MYRGRVWRDVPNTKHPQEMPEHFPVYVTAQAEADNLHM